ncbi:SGNH/GDSL hydrolase family protein [Paenibacillus sanguinis]|uniref:SGNH/GDSL hydrolase family protein n=1 Tax=Paenibacillus sanguinis TaxID=225906 RepID=UPI00037AC762|nr:SGNH/GDSL hydrolase family protein [Paenibacillus sanguinis]
MNEAPKAPKDPDVRRSSFYVMYENRIEGTLRPDGTYSHEIYLEGRLVEKARYMGGVMDEEILRLLQDCEGVRRLVHSIGVTVKADHAQPSPVQFVYQNWGHTSKYESGTRIELTCLADGSETLLSMEEVEWGTDDDVPGSFTFIFARPGERATVSVVFYLHKGFHIPDISPEGAIAFDSEAYRRLIASSLLNRGHNRRLKAAIQKAKRGEKVTIAFIGGSITQGAGAVPIHEQCYAYQACERFKQRFSPGGEAEIQLIKAGVGGTSSELGVVRYERDVLREGQVAPDIVVIEFAVNDAGDETEGNCFESLALKAWQGPGNPAVILLFSVFADDWNLQERLAPVGWHFDFPMVSVKDALVPQFRLTKAEGNIISKRQFFYDIYHPTNDGHRVMADCLDELFRVTDALPLDDGEAVMGKPPIIGDDFVHLKLLDRHQAERVAEVEPGGFTGLDTDLQMVEMDAHSYRSAQFPDNWMYEPHRGRPEFCLKLSGKRLILIFKDSGSAEFGCAELWVDGQYLKRLDPHENGWTHCNPVLLYNEQETREHTVIIRMVKGEEHKRFTVLGFGYE